MILRHPNILAWNALLKILGLFCCCALVLPEVCDASFLSGFDIVSRIKSKDSAPCTISVPSVRTRPLFSISAGNDGSDRSNGNNADGGVIEEPPITITPEGLSVAVIGGGWAGFSAADALSAIENDSSGSSAVKVHLLDASPRGPGGLSGGWRTPKLNRPVEAGIHGFWREYRNTFAAIERIGLKIDDVLTPYTPSLLVSSSGRVALAPVLGEGGEVESPFSQDSPSIGSLDPTTSILKQISDLLPPPLDVAFLADFDKNSPLTVADRISAVGLLGAWADFEVEDADSWARYDKISADNLFRSIAGVSPNLYKELVAPLLHVLPMTPAYDCSAAAALSCFHVFALQARGAFDVRWCRGSISEKIFNPWVSLLKSRGNVEIRGSSKVTSLEERRNPRSGEKRYSITINDKEKLECDSVVFAVGAVSANKLLDACPPLQELGESTSLWKGLRGITCVAVRLFISSSDGKLPDLLAEPLKDSPVVVCGPEIGGIPELVETGFCIYDLTRLQDEAASDSDTVALEVDFFRSDSIAALKDEEVLSLTLKAISKALGMTAQLDPDLVLDSSVVRAREAVSHFCVGSAARSPPVKLKKGIYICGDWVDRSGHSSWSTEKAVVTGRQAAGALADDFSLKFEAEIVPSAPDTSQLSTLRRVSKAIRQVSPEGAFPLSPWLLLNQFGNGISRR